MIQWIADLVGANSWALDWIQTGMICVQDKTRPEGRQAYELRDALRRPAQLDALGCGGWDEKGILRHIGLDLDVGHGSGKNARFQFKTTDDAIGAARRIRELVGGAAEIRRSKSGAGIHVRVAVAGEIVCGRVRKKDIGVGGHAAKWIIASLKLPADPTAAGRQNLWFWAKQRGELGFELLEKCVGSWEVPDDARTEAQGRPSTSNQSGERSVSSNAGDTDGRSGEKGIAVAGGIRTGQPANSGNRKTGSSANSSVISDYDRAELYIRKVGAAGQGNRNKALYELTMYVLEHFRLSEGEIQSLCAPWAASCSPAMNEHEARETVRSAYRSAAAKQIIGSKWTAPKQKGEGRPPLPALAPGGPETQIEIPDGFAGNMPASQAPAQNNASEASSSSAVPARPLETVPASAPAGEIDRLFQELTPHVKAAAVDLAEGDGFAGMFGSELQEVDQAEAEGYFEKKFEDELFAAVHANALKRDALVKALFQNLAKYLPCMEATTVTRVRASVCKNIGISRGDFNQILRQSRSGERSESNEVDFVALGRAFLKSLRPSQWLVYWREEWYHWERTTGIYARRSQKWFQKFAGEWLIAMKVPVTVTVMGNLRLVLEIETFLADECKPGQWLGDARKAHGAGVYMVLGNGILNLEKPADPLIEHTPDYWAINGVGYKYDATATCDKFHAALEKWQAQPDGQTWAIQLLQDWTGYCLDPGNREQKLLINKGDGNDAKSTYAHILKATVGEGNVAACGLEAFDPKKNFGLMPLLGKTLNITGDATHVDRIGEGLIKSITGGDAITIDRKNIQPITEVLDCKFMMNCNRMPMFQDQSEGIWRRMLVLEWRTIPEKDVIRDFHKILIAEEISGIFNWALEGFARVRKNGFQRQGVLKESLDNARATVQPWINFFEESIEWKDADGKAMVLEANCPLRTYSERLVEAYRDFCRRHNIDSYLYEGNLGRELKRWLRKCLLEAGVEETVAKGALDGPEGKDFTGLKRRDSASEAGSKKRKTYYHGIVVRQDSDDQEAAPKPAAGFWK